LGAYAAFTRVKRAPWLNLTGCDVRIAPRNLPGDLSTTSLREPRSPKGADAARELTTAAEITKFVDPVVPWATPAYGTLRRPTTGSCSSGVPRRRRLRRRRRLSVRGDVIGGRRKRRRRVSRVPQKRNGFSETPRECYAGSAGAACAAPSRAT